jgi:GT2 family glycosyltransferase
MVSMSHDDEALQLHHSHDERRTPAVTGRADAADGFRAHPQRVDRETARDMPRLAVVLVNWNNASTTLRCVSSLLCGTVTPRDVLVVDNGSSDRSLSVLEELLPDRVTLLTTARNGGFAFGANAGIRAALAGGADLVWLLNNDTTVERTCVERLLEAAQDDSTDAFVSMVVFASDPDRVWFNGGAYRTWSATVLHGTGDHPPTGPVGFASGCSLVVRSRVFHSLGMLDERFFLYWEDVEFSERMRHHGRRVQLVSEARVRHQAGDSSGGGHKGTSATYFYYNARNRLWYVREFQRGWERRTALVWTLPWTLVEFARILLRDDAPRAAKVLALMRGVRDGLSGNFSKAAPLLSTRRPRPAFVTWMNYHGRSRGLGRDLAADLLFIDAGHILNPRTAPVRWLVSAVRTWTALARRRPNTVYVMVPPLPALLACWTYCGLTRCPLVIDMHTGVFNDPRWRWARSLTFAIARRSRLSLVTNTALVEVLERAGVRATALHDPPLPAITVPQDGRAVLKPPHPTIVVPSSFMSDEPVAEVLNTARLLPNVEFLLTGTPLASLVKKAETIGNITLTGYLPQQEYAELIASASVVLCLTTRQHTMQRGGYEALAAHVPLVTSDFAVLREYFSLGTLFVAPNAESIAAAVAEAVVSRDRLSVEMQRLYQEKLDSWPADLARVRQLVEVGGG